MTDSPADQLRAAAKHLRTGAFRGAMTATPAVAGLVRAREPLAELLDFHAKSHDATVTAADRVFVDEPEAREGFIRRQTNPHAIAVARAVLGIDPPKEGS